MPEPSDNTDNKDLPEKYRGKTAAEIAKMHEESERKLGEQGTELGQLRATVQALQSAPAREPQHREPARTDEYRRYAEDLIVNPEETVPSLARDIEDRAVARVRREMSEQRSTEDRINGWFAQNEELAQFREIVLVIAGQIFQRNPNASIEQTLEAAKPQALQYITSLKERLDKDKGKKKDGITTSGGPRPDDKPDKGEDRRGDEDLDPSQQAILDEINSLSKWRSNRAAPPRAR